MASTIRPNALQPNILGLTKPFWLRLVRVESDEWAEVHVALSPHWAGTAETVRSRSSKPPCAISSLVRESRRHLSQRIDALLSTAKHRGKRQADPDDDRYSGCPQVLVHYEYGLDLNHSVKVSNRSQRVRSFARTSRPRRRLSGQ